ncbi:MAG: serine racemase VanT catalytic subunit [Clostridia bacterium]|nr:serine racemase VanT catalytic subunit [Clostridia bacterium]
MEEELTKQNRAWLEINLDNLEHNVNQIKSIIPDKCKIMAIVKANAYGHGMIEIAKKLNEIGVQDFAVATLSEGINLRKNNIKGNILILGYTDLKDVEYIIKYDLIQTIVDYEYAKKIEKMKLEDKLKVHIKINTGMNRIGESYKNIDNLIKTYQIKNIEILGTYSHLCVADSLKSDDVEFTNEQINNFFECIDKIKSLGYDTGKIHIQASYGILNYPELNCDFVRPGIIMYGIYNEDEPKTRLNLKSVLTLKARITSVKEIEEDESVSYGRTFIAKTKKRIATVCIGYADGYPRNLGNKDVQVMVNGQFAEIIGRICMDQLIIDVSQIKEIHQGDIVTLMGEQKEISAETIANKADTITNELLSRLGSRLGRTTI